MGKARTMRRAAAQQQGNPVSPEAVTAKMHLNPTQARQLHQMVLAGMAIMFSKKSHPLFLKQLQGPDPISYKIGKGVAGLCGLMMQESRGSLPPNLLIPAGTVLVAEVAQWLNKAGTTVTPQDVAGAIETMTDSVLHAGGVDPEKVKQIGGAHLAKTAAQPAQVAP